MNTQQKDPFFIKPTQLSTVPHHTSFRNLWETKWRKPAELGVYPFMFGYVGDFEPIVNALSQSQMKEPYNWDAYASSFFPTAINLFLHARKAERDGRLDEACEYYLRASAVYRIARFPLPRSTQQLLAWEHGKDAAIQGLRLKEHPVVEVRIPHRFRVAHEGSHIPVMFCLPNEASLERPVSVQIIITGLDGYRTDLAVWSEGFSKLGVATLIHEIPGTGDCPALAGDPTSPDRLYDSVLTWIEENSKLDSSKVSIWGFSTGGYYAIRAAHTHASRLRCVVAQGGGAHYMFHPTWLEQVNRLEYPFDLANCLSFKFGYGDDVEAFKREGMEKFSLLLDGTLDRPDCAPLLLVNGLEDEIFPIDDYFLLLQHGSTKQARFVANEKHMGEPDAFPIILSWIYDQLDVQDCNSWGHDEKEENMNKMIKMHLGSIPFKARYTFAEVQPMAVEEEYVTKL